MSDYDNGFDSAQLDYELDCNDDYCCEQCIDKDRQIEQLKEENDKLNKLVEEIENKRFTAVYNKEYLAVISEDLQQENQQLIRENNILKRKNKELENLYDNCFNTFKETDKRENDLKQENQQLKQELLELKNDNENLLAENQQYLEDSEIVSELLEMLELDTEKDIVNSIQNMQQELAEIKSKLPKYKIGDYVYFLNNTYKELEYITIEKGRIWEIINLENYEEPFYNISSYGNKNEKFIFATEQEAQEALKRYNNGK